MQGRCDHRFGSGSTVFFQQVFFERPAIDSNSDRYSLCLRRPHDFPNAFVSPYVPGIQTEFIDARFKGHQREFVMEMNVSDKWNVGNPFANLLQGHRSVVIGNSETHHLAASAYHLFNLSDSTIDISGVTLGH